MPDSDDSIEKSKEPRYRLRFFFDYYCGGCLWSGNEAAYKKFDFWAHR